MVMLKYPRRQKSVFQKFITEYFEKRRQLVCAFVLIDIRHEAQKIDLEFMEYLGESGIPFSIIFTKADKVGKTKVPQLVAAYKKELLNGIWEEVPPYFITSSEEKTGREDILAYIDSINQDIFKNPLPI